MLEFEVVFLLIGAMIFVTLYFEGRKGWKNTGNQRVGVTLPHDKVHESMVQDVVTMYKRQWILSIIFGVIMWIPVFFILDKISYLILYIFAWSVCCMFGTLWIQKKYFRIMLQVKRENGWYMPPPKDIHMDAKMYADGDIYWEKGFYLNPTDSNLFITKRFGHGTTINFGTKFGKILGAIFATLFVILFVTIVWVFSQFERENPFEVTIQSDLVQIETLFYDYEFAYSDIESIYMQDTFPPSYRTNGMGLPSIRIGNFMIEGYGRSKVYVYNNRPPYLFVQLKDMTVVLNGKTEIETRILYEALHAEKKKSYQ